jgi:Ser/Thr protein kinase RdoA (MazF antagonist)
VWHDRGVGDGQPPAGLLRAGGLEVLPGDVRPREGRAWLVGWHGTLAVLRQSSGSAQSMRWLHAFLARLAGRGFPSPCPLPVFGGRSHLTTAGMVWEVVSYLPGQVVGWADEPPLEEIGALMGRYHAAARQTGVTGQRPGELPLARVPAVLLSGQPERAGIAPGRVSAIRRLARRLDRDLRQASHLTGERLVIHGDFTSHNVIATGTPPHACGVIDFAGAHAETPLADIAYGLWRSGRPRQEAQHLDLDRARRFLRGYADTSPVSASQAGVIPVYMYGRGLQMIAKRVRAGRAETGMLAQARWLNRNASTIGDALADVVS